jgi:hypothetical protein
MLNRATLGYFCAPAGHYWEWDIDAPMHQNPCVVWSGGESTVVFRQELTQLLEALVPQGLPSLGAILMVLAATSDSWDAEAMRNRLFAAGMAATGSESPPGGIVTAWDHVAPGLEAIHRLPADLRTTVISRSSLLRTVFEQAFNRLSVAISETVLKEFIASPYLECFRDRTPDLNGVSRMLWDLGVLQKALLNLELDQLENLLRTGVPGTVSGRLELPPQTPDTVPVPELPADLLRALENEGGELAQIAGLVRHLSAVLHVPKPMVSREDLPLGGVSDITNRGDPSRLLMTELAWDDLTFAVRLAQGEALYLRRESPPAEPPPRRILLLDNGIFLWGKPRLFALGVALTLLRQKDARSAILTVVDSCFRPVSLATVEDVRAQLTRLEPQPSPLAALSEFALTEEYGPRSFEEEVFLITHPSSLETLTQFPVWHSLAAHAPLHSVQVDREGELTLTRHSQAGGRVLSHCRVEPDFLLGESKPAAALTRGSAASLTDAEALLPQFYRERRWPLYHPALPEGDQFFYLDDYHPAGISTAGCVASWIARSGAGRVLHPTAPARKLLSAAVDPDDSDQVVFIFRNPPEPILHILVTSINGNYPNRLFTLQERRVSFNDCRFQSGALILNLRYEVKAISVSDGAILGTARHSDFVKGVPWFDGERFHEPSESDDSPPPLARSQRPQRWADFKRNRLEHIASAGFSLLGGLVIQTGKGRNHELLLDDKGRLNWQQNLAVKATFSPLQPMDLPGWPDHGLTQAQFTDGRRIVYDPRGFLHVIGTGPNPHELSLVLVKGSTAAWQRTGFFYGDISLLWGEPIGATQSLKAVFRSLFRAVDNAPSSITLTGS